MFTVINRNATGHDNMTKNRMEIGSEKMGLQQLLCSKKWILGRLFGKVGHIAG
jgi:hypothetical protein